MDGVIRLANAVDIDTVVSTIITALREELEWWYSLSSASSGPAVL